MQEVPCTRTFITTNFVGPTDTTVGLGLFWQTSVCGTQISSSTVRAMLAQPVIELQQESAGRISKHKPVHQLAMIIE